MEHIQKDQESILSKLGIKELNKMQLDTEHAFNGNDEIILLSPTGTGKTLAFLLPIIKTLDRTLHEVQSLIIVPSRELAIQIEQVAREMGTGFKINAVYGGRAGFKDKSDLQQAPAILIGTPGRLADHLRKESFSVDHIKTLVLDEFDKSLEMGYEKEMKEILKALPALEKKVLCSATQKLLIPDFVELQKPFRVDFLGSIEVNLEIFTIKSPSRNKYASLANLIAHLGDARGIIFCNLKDTINEVSNYLYQNKIPHTNYFGSMDQIGRERSLVKFRNGTHRLLLATDLAARGIDVPELDFIIHYQLPLKKNEFIHRNGRTARMKSDGTAYLLLWEKDQLPSYIKNAETLHIEDTAFARPTKWTTLYISGGRNDKISKGDIAGLFFKKGNLASGELGIIEISQECSFVAVPKSKAKKLISLLNNNRLKKKKVRISYLE